MSDAGAAAPDPDDVEATTTPGYAVPKQKDLNEILNQDKGDESLEKYKQTLLGDAAATPFPDDPRKLIISKLRLISPGREDLVMDLSGDLSKLKKQTFTITEGCTYEIQFEFFVQREIVTGLKYLQGTYRLGIRVDKEEFMMGSYGPKKDVQSFKTPSDTAPSGAPARGKYTIKSKFIDDDGNNHLKLEWTLEIKKDKS